MNFNRDQALDSFFIFGTSFHLVPGKLVEFVPYVELSETANPDVEYTLVCQTIHGDSPLAAPTPDEVWQEIRVKLDELCERRGLPHITIGQVIATGNPRPGGEETVIDIPPANINS